MTTTTAIRRLGGEGILTDRDLAELSAGCRRVFTLMRDGAWHDAAAIRAAAGQHGVPASEGLRRLRELRQFVTVERTRHGAGRDFRYRIVWPERPAGEPKQQALFGTFAAQTAATEWDDNWAD